MKSGESTFISVIEGDPTDFRKTAIFRRGALLSTDANGVRW